jgi:hypothetical protein
VRITREPGEINWGDAGRSGFEPGPFRIFEVSGTRMLSVGIPGARPSRASLGGTAAELEVGGIERPGEAAGLPPALVPFYQLPGQLGYWQPELWRDAGVLSRELFFEPCLANVHRESSFQGKAKQSSRVSGCGRQT